MNVFATHARLNSAAKAFLVALLVLVGSFVIGPHDALAQSTCKPDCFDPASEWGVVQSTNVTFPNGCILKVYFQTRLACGLWYDVFISKVETLMPGGTTECNTYFGFFGPHNPKSILDYVTDNLLIANPMGFPPDPSDPDEEGHCRTNWRVVKGACWRRVELCNGFHGSRVCYLPCQLTEYCLEPYTVCVVNGQRVVQLLPPGSTSNNTCNGLTQGCEPVCRGPVTP